MNQRDESFTPETVDEQVDRLLRSASSQEDMPSAEMVQMLQGIYAEDPRLQRVWERLAERAASTRPIAEAAEKRLLPSRLSSPVMRFPQERSAFMQTQARIPEQKPKRSFFQQRLSQVAAVFLLVVLVGSLVTVLQLSRQKSSGQSGTHSANAPSATTSSKIGKIVYSSGVQPGSLVGLAWSADGKRLAVAGNAMLYIWDATTGKNRITVPLSSPPGPALAWSPTSNLLAVTTQNNVIVVDGQTGKTIATCSPLAATAANASTGTAPLVRQTPLGGGWNFGGIAWAPNGKWIASTFTNLAGGVVQVWNPQTGKLAYTLATVPGYAMGNIAWSPDGAYIAVMVNGQLSVWNVATRQVVFQQPGDQYQEGQDITWQPGTDNLALSLGAVGGNKQEMDIWNIPTKQVIKSIPGVSGVVSWSPDGQEFVYNSYKGGSASKASLTIFDLTSGKAVYTYQVSEPTATDVGFLIPAWSPTGAYIATGENIASLAPGGQGTMFTYMLKVWVA